MWLVFFLLHPPMFLFSSLYMFHILTMICIVGLFTFLTCLAGFMHASLFFFTLGHDDTVMPLALGIFYLISVSNLKVCFHGISYYLCVPFLWVLNIFQTFCLFHLNPLLYLQVLIVYLWTSWVFLLGCWVFQFLLLFNLCFLQWFLSSLNPVFRLWFIFVTLFSPLFITWLFSNPQYENSDCEGNTGEVEQQIQPSSESWLNRS